MTVSVKSLMFAIPLTVLLVCNAQARSLDRPDLEYESLGSAVDPDEDYQEYPEPMSLLDAQRMVALQRER